MADDDYTLMTTDSMAIILNDDGCCVRHPRIKLKEYDKNGNVYLTEACHECDREFRQTQAILLEKRRELDLKLQELGEDSPHDERHADFVKMVSPQDLDSLRTTFGTVDSPTQEQERAPEIRPDSPLATQEAPGGITLDMLASQIDHMKHMQDVLMNQKDQEVQELRQKVREQQEELVQKQVEIALMKDRMAQQQEQMERELRFIQRALAKSKSAHASSPTRGTHTLKEIRIGELHVQVAQQDVDKDVLDKLTEAANRRQNIKNDGEKISEPAALATSERTSEISYDTTSTPEASNIVSAAAVGAAAAVETDRGTSPEKRTANMFEPAILRQVPQVESVIEEPAIEDERKPAIREEITFMPTPEEQEQPEEVHFIPPPEEERIEDMPVDVHYEPPMKDAPPASEENGQPVEIHFMPPSEEEEEAPKKEAPVEIDFIPPMKEKVQEAGEKQGEKDSMPGQSKESSAEFTVEPETSLPSGFEQPPAAGFEEQEDDMKDEGSDEFDASGDIGLNHPNKASLFANKDMSAPDEARPGLLTAAHPSNHRGNPMHASSSSLHPPREGLKLTSDGIPGMSRFPGHGPRGNTPMDELEINGDALPTVPLQEQITLATAFVEPSDSFTPLVVGEPNEGGPVDEDHTQGSPRTSMYGEDREKVEDHQLLDPYGDQGTYSGVVLKSTGLPHGSGRMIYEDDGRTYEGDWRHGRWHGWGCATFSNGDSFEGFYRYDQRHGQGRYQWSDGRVYDGGFHQDKRHGKGVFDWPDGAKYVGEFSNGKRHGYGEYTFADGGHYVGEWVNGRYEGYGECTWADGRIYKGDWKAGMAHGEGTETYPNGKIRHSGQWIEDAPVR